MNPIFLLYLVGFLPSFIWLIFYLRKDIHPESNKMILRVFLGGIIITAPALFLEIGFNEFFSFLKTQGILIPLLFTLFTMSIIEEYGKYLVVKLNVLRSSEIDEPFDILLYLIISALGFAALENILVLAKHHPLLTIENVFWLMFLRFLLTVFFHALSSASFGFFIALSYLYTRQKKFLFCLGLLTSSLLHTLYNFFIIQLTSWSKIVLPLILLIVMALFVSFAIKKLKKIKSLCLFGTN